MNKITIRDGKVVLYTRKEGGIYHARLSVDGVDGYVVRTTGQRNVERAREIAENLYDDIRYKVRHGEEIGIQKFRSVWNRWLKAHQNTLSDHRKRYIVGTANRYFIPFLGEREIGQISEKIIEQYWDWRINFWISEEGVAKIERAARTRTTGAKPYKNKLGNVARIPSQKSLDMERTVLGQILGWAQRTGLISRLPLIKTPKLNSTVGVVRRPSFELDEWKKLYRFLRNWVKSETLEGRSKTQRGPNRRHIYQRELLINYILFMESSGLRPNEARQLRWKDIIPHVDKNGNENVVIYVSPTTKTGARNVIPLRNAPVLLERLRLLSTHTRADDLIFADSDGQPVENFGKTFKKVLILAGLLTDRFGKERTIYSLRHTYATFCLAYGKVRIEDLAQNMGTSPATIYAHYRHITTLQISHVLGGTLHAAESRKGLFL